jgi:hypothetical protein
MTTTAASAATTLAICFHVNHCGAVEGGIPCLAKPGLRMTPALRRQIQKAKAAR